MFFQPIWAFTQRYTVATCVFPSRTPKAMATMAIGNDSASRCEPLEKTNEWMVHGWVKFLGWFFEFFFEFVPQKNNKWKRQKQPTYQGKAVRISSCWVFCYLPGCDFFVAVFTTRKAPETPWSQELLGVKRNWWTTTIRYPLLVKAARV